MENNYVIEMEHITKTFPGIKANDDITLKIKSGEIHALLGENGAGKSTLMSVLFGMYEPDEGTIKIKGKEVKIKDPNVANELGVGMVHQHFKLVDVFSVLENITLGVETIKHVSWNGRKMFNLLKKGKKLISKKESESSEDEEFEKWGGQKFFKGCAKVANFLNDKVFHVIDNSSAERKVNELSKKYGLDVECSAKIEDISVGMQQRTEILKMLYRDNDILIFDEPTAVLTPNEIDELLKIMKNLASEGKSILFITHKLNEIMAVADSCTILRKGKYIATVDVKQSSKEELSRLMVGRDISFSVDKKEMTPGEEVLRVENLSMADKIHHGKNSVSNISFNVRRGEIVCIAGIDGNGQTEAVYGITGLEKALGGKITFLGEDITSKSIFDRNNMGLSHIPEDRHKHGLVLDYKLDYNMVLENYWKKDYTRFGFLRKRQIRAYAEELIAKYDVRSGEGTNTITRSMSGGNQQKAIVAREIERNPELLIAVQPTRGLDVGAIEFIHKQIVAERDAGKGVLLVSLELDEVLDLSDRILIMFEGEIVGEVDPKTTTPQELSMYMSGAKRDYVFNPGGNE